MPPKHRVSARGHGGVPPERHNHHLLSRQVQQRHLQEAQGALSQEPAVEEEVEHIEAGEEPEEHQVRADAPEGVTTQFREGPQYGQELLTEVVEVLTGVDRRQLIYEATGFVAP